MHIWEQGALNKESWRNKFELKGNEYIFVCYSEESKAYRLEKSGTIKIIKLRDIRSNEKLSEENTKTNEYFEAFSNMFKTYNETSEDRAEINTDNEETIEDPTLLYEEESCESTSIKSTTKRILWRPKILRTSKRGRPIKLFH